MLDFILGLTNWTNTIKPFAFVLIVLLIFAGVIISIVLAVSASKEKNPIRKKKKRKWSIVWLVVPLVIFSLWVGFVALVHSLIRPMCCHQMSPPPDNLPPATGEFR